MDRIVNHVVVVGGGAAGIFAAIACAEANPAVAVTVLDAAAKPLGKVKISGGGRCNVTHACFDPAELVTHYPRGHRALKGAFRQFQPNDTVQWFTQRGVRLKTEPDGRMFPTTDQSQTIIDCLLELAHRHQVSIHTRTAVAAVTSEAGGFQLRLKSGDRTSGNRPSGNRPSGDRPSGDRIWADRLLLATGSSPSGYRLAQSLGHTLETPVPSLFTFTISDAGLRSLAGIALDPVRIRLMIPGSKPLEQIGPLLITHWGMSGPAVLKLSAWGARILHDCQYHAPIQINWLPNMKQEGVRQRLMHAKVVDARKAIASSCPMDLPRRFWRYLLNRAPVDPDLRWADLSKKNVHTLLQTLQQDNYDIVGKGVFKDEFVTCGGVPLKEINFKTMASRQCPHLFFAGEIVDVDGVTGGFNFQNAWTTGWLAGQALAHSFAPCEFQKQD